MKKSVNKESLKKSVYSAAALGLCITALLAFWMSNRNNNLTLPEESETVSFAPTVTAKEEEAVNTPVTDVPDERYSAAPVTEAEMPAQRVYFAMPMDSGINREYSNGTIVKNSTTDDWRTHDGVDLSGVAGDAVKAINNGTVIAVRDDALWGTVVTIDHGNGITAEYRGLDRDGAVQPGDTVNINDKVGVLGDIPVEKNDGAHLHLELYKDGKLVSPSEYIGKTVEQ